MKGVNQMLFCVNQINLYLPLSDPFYSTFFVGRNEKTQCQYFLFCSDIVGIFSEYGKCNQWWGASFNPHVEIVTLCEIFPKVLSDILSIALHFFLNFHNF